VVTFIDFRKAWRYSAKHLNDLDFANDTSLLESSIARARVQLTHSTEAAASVGLMINTMVANSINDFRRCKALGWSAFRISHYVPPTKARYF